MAGKPLTIEGDGEPTRDFTHVRDVVRAEECGDGLRDRGWTRAERWTYAIPALIFTKPNKILGWHPQVTTEGLAELIKAQSASLHGNPQAASFGRRSLP